MIVGYAKNSEVLPLWRIRLRMWRCRTGSQAFLFALWGHSKNHPLGDCARVQWNSNCGVLKIVVRFASLICRCLDDPADHGCQLTYTVWFTADPLFYLANTWTCLAVQIRSGLSWWCPPLWQGWRIEFCLWTSSLVSSQWRMNTTLGILRRVLYSTRSTVFCVASSALQTASCLEYVLHPT